MTKTVIKTNDRKIQNNDSDSSLKEIEKCHSRKKNVRRNGARYNSFIKPIYKLARSIQSLAGQAVKEYTPIVETIVSTKCRDTQHIERTLDGLLNFCFDPNILLIYKKLCRYYYDMDPIATASYVNIYREMWDSK